MSERGDNMRGASNELLVGRGELTDTAAYDQAWVYAIFLSGLAEAVDAIEDAASAYGKDREGAADA